MTGLDAASSPPQACRSAAEDDLFDRLRLLRSRRVGAATYGRLLREHGTARAALAALPDIARAAGAQGYSICPEGVIAAEMRAGSAAGARLIGMHHVEYPPALAQIADAPPLIWAKGQSALLRRPMIALVGARNASSLGTRMARMLAKELGEAGFVVVSGLARGVDTAAHLASLETGTIAVQAGGVDTIYPRENTKLAGDIAAQGLRLSEMPMGMQPQARHFPARNRIIAGMSRAVVVIEAAARSGSLITARNALDQGREVLAVPGHPFDARAAGCNMLLRDGAVLIRSAADVIDVVGSADAVAARDTYAELGREVPVAAMQHMPQPKQDNSTGTVPVPGAIPGHASPPARSLRETARLHDDILSRLGPSPLAEDQLIRDLNRPATRVTSVIIGMELDGKITRQPGGLLALTQ